MSESLHEVCQEELPETLREIRDVIGWPATMTLVSEMGGLKVIVPKKLTRNHLLVEMLGWEAASKLSEVYAGEVLKIPRAISALRCLRDREILRRYDAGERLAILAREHHLDLRTIERIIPRASLKEAERRERASRQLVMTFGE
ncbi:hypothetical protein SIID45300_02409 [Candidatus Magnetaquicoccaceae bacterium FCR-1]|uniref:Mor transcription activator domain-containing protein n=1 Tax=Candidatus Magnetaquiglobus chichijimensis TaxID=3141448 RepID=A0ABQ0CB03_9PROT